MRPSSIRSVDSKWALYVPTAVSIQRSSLNCLEARALNYIIAVRCYSNIKRSIYGLKDWVEICDGIEVCEFIHQSEQKAAKPRRHFVVRKRIERPPEAEGKLLFEDLHEYRYSTYVTNLELPVIKIWDLYNDRADCENRIKELKQDFGACSKNSLKTIVAT